MQKVNIGIVGCGDISNIYFKNLTELFLHTNIYACADLVEERARAKAQQWNVPHVMTFEQMLACDDIQIILNLTTPNAHYPICKAALEAGKHVYVEKPLAVTLKQGMELVELAKQKDVYLGGAPDTFMGAGIQTCRKLLDDGLIGRPVAGGAFMMCHGWEGKARNHPDPAFYFHKGAGPMMDMGAYYLTALITLLGPIAQIHAMNTMGEPTRITTSAAKYGDVIDVEVDTHVAGLIRFVSGTVISIITTFEAWVSSLPTIELYGTRGTLAVPDPNNYGHWGRDPIPGFEAWARPVQLAVDHGDGYKEVPFEFRDMPLTHTYAWNSRGLGIEDMAQCILAGSGQPRANCELTLHVLEAMLALCEGKPDYMMKTTCVRPQPMRPDVTPGLV